MKTESLTYAMNLATMSLDITPIVEPAKNSYVFDIKNYRLPMGEKFGKWAVCGETYTVTGRRKGSQFRKPMVPCKCECGALKDVIYYSLKNGKSTQCVQCVYEGRRKISFAGEDFSLRGVA